MAGDRRDLLVAERPHGLRGEQEQPRRRQRERVGHHEVDLEDRARPDAGRRARGVHGAAEALGGGAREPQRPRERDPRAAEGGDDRERRAPERRAGPRVERVRDEGEPHGGDGGVWKEDRPRREPPAQHLAGADGATAHRPLDPQPHEERRHERRQRDREAHDHGVLDGQVIGLQLREDRVSHRQQEQREARRRARREGQPCALDPRRRRRCGGAERRDSHLRGGPRGQERRCEREGRPGDETHSLEPTPPGPASFPGARARASPASASLERREERVHVVRLARDARRRSPCRRCACASRRRRRRAPMASQIESRLTSSSRASASSSTCDRAPRDDAVGLELDLVAEVPRGAVDVARRLERRGSGP